MRVLVTGATGMLGEDLLNTASTHEFVGIDRSQLDITNLDACIKAVQGFDAVVNCAAYTAVDDAESNEDTAYAVNATGAENIAKACATHGALLIQISTDYVFNGNATEPYAANETRSPIGVYGKTKAIGEELALAANPDTVILRTAWLYSAKGHNFMRTMLKLASGQNTVSVVTDQQGQPTSTTEVIHTILAVLDGNVRHGIFHATCAGSASWYEFAQAIFAQAGTDPQRVLPTTSTEFPRPAPRPAYSVLSHQTLEELRTPTQWQVALRHEIERLREIEPELLNAQTKPRVLVTGAGGYIGRYVVAALSRLGATPVAVVRPGKNIDFGDNAEILHADIFAGDPADIFRQADCTKLIHLAWQDGFEHNNNSHLANLMAHLNFLQQASEHGYTQLSVLGSMHEIGYYEGAVTADTPTNPRSLYGIAKDALRRASQITIKTENSNLQWLRCYYITGDDLANQSIFTKLLQAVENGATAFDFTTGKNKYDFIDVSDLGEQIAICALSPDSGIINCCSGEPVSLGDRVEKFIADNDLNITLNYGVYPERAYDSPAIWGDASRIKEITAKFYELRGTV